MIRFLSFGSGILKLRLNSVATDPPLKLIDSLIQAVNEKLL